jgi:hypothetical protein
MRVTPENITKLNENEIFVFGSNTAGIHGLGAAKLALQFGAVFGQGIGMFGSTYAIPTKDLYIKTLSLYKINNYVNDFIAFTEQHKSLKFLVTKIGCGLAGFKPEQIAPMFKKALTLENVYLPQDFIECIS